MKHFSQLLLTKTPSFLAKMWVALSLLLGYAGVASAEIQIGFSPAVVNLNVGQSARVAVIVNTVADPGLAAFQFTLRFAPGPIDVVNPNEAFRTSISPFAPLGNNPFCTFVRGATPCPDPAWFLTTTGRSVVGTDKIDNVSGLVTVAYGSSGSQVPAIGNGVIALIDVVAAQDGSTTVELTDVILADNQVPPRAQLFKATALAVNVGQILPNVPQNLQVRAKLRHINLTWEGGVGATGFAVFRRLNNESTFTLLARTPEHVYVDNLPATASAGEYYVVAENAQGSSGTSNTVVVVPQNRLR